MSFFEPKHIKRVLFVSVLFALVHLILALTYGSITPFLTSGVLKSENHQIISDIGAPDERAHVDYVCQLIAGKGLPFLDVSRMHTDKTYRENEYENHQPPLFYTLDAIWAKCLGANSNPTSSDGLKFRSLNSLIGAVEVLGVFFVAFETYGNPLLALLAESIAALLPMNTALSGAVSNDPLLICLSVWTLYLCIRGVKRGWNFKLVILVGAAIGLAFLDKSSGLTLVFVAIGAAMMPQKHKPKSTWILAAVGVFVVLAAPILIRNQELYGDPLAMHAFNLAFQDTATPATIHKVIEAQGGSPGIDYWTNWVGWWTARSFIGVFGYMDIWLNETGLPYASAHAPNTLYRISLAVIAILSIGWVASLKSSFQRKNINSVWVHAILLAITIIVFIRFNMQYFQAQARYLMPAIGAIATGLAAGGIYSASPKEIDPDDSSGSTILKQTKNERRQLGLAIMMVIGLMYLQFVSVQRISSSFHERILVSETSYRYGSRENFIKMGAWCRLS